MTEYGYKVKKTYDSLRNYKKWLPLQPWLNQPPLQIDSIFGMKLRNPKKGLNIVNGKKVIVK